MKTFQQIGTEIGALVETKNAAYGFSFERCGEFLRILFAEGIQPERYDEVLLAARVFDKLMRIATDRDAFGESPWMNIAGYAILGHHLHLSKKENASPCFDARYAASQSPTSKPASVDSSASERPTTSASASNEPATGKTSTAASSESSAGARSKGRDVVLPNFMGIEGSK